MLSFWLTRAGRRLIFAFLITGAGMCAADVSAVGIWQTIDDKTHQPRGTVRLYEQAGVIFGKIEASSDPREGHEICQKCEGTRHNQPIIGMIFLRNMRRQGKEYIGGDILDPDSGRVYDCKMSLTDGGKKLVVVGFYGISLLGRSQVWIRQ